MNSTTWAQFTDEERDALIAGHDAFRKSLEESGELVGVEGLAEEGDAKSVRLRGGVPVVTDGPFVEAKEFLGSFYMIDCVSLERAIEIAARCPDAAYNAVEVRPLLEAAEA